MYFYEQKNKENTFIHSVQVYLFVDFDNTIENSYLGSM